MKYRSGFQIVGHIPAFSQEVISREPGVRGVDAAWIREYGSPILRAFLEAMPADWRDRDFQVRARAVWLKKGWLPGPSRFHCDQSYGRPDGLPDYANQLKGKHTIACFAGDCSRTVFVDDDLELPDVPDGQPQDLLYHALIQARIAAGTLRTKYIGEGELALFGEGDFHDVSPAEHTGWRYFMRATERSLGRHVVGDIYDFSESRNGYQPGTRAETHLYGAYRPGPRPSPVAVRPA